MTDEVEKRLYWELFNLSCHIKAHLAYREIFVVHTLCRGLLSSKDFKSLFKSFIGELKKQNLRFSILTEIEAPLIDFNGRKITMNVYFGEETK